jgi:hypothetical protein
VSVERSAGGRRWSINNGAWGRLLVSMDRFARPPASSPTPRPGRRG